MTDELLPALPESELWTYGGEARPMKPAYTEDQMRAYAREAIRLSHTWPTLRDDAALPGGGVEELRAEIARLERAVEDAKYRSMVDARISYHGFSYGTGSQWGIDSLREAIRKGGDA